MRGTRASGAQVLTAGGRVLCAVGLGESIAAAQREAYELVHAIHWDGVQYRRDIGDGVRSAPHPASEEPSAPWRRARDVDDNSVSEYGETRD